MTQQSLSIWEKSEERSIAKKYLHGNFKAGHRTPNEHYLSRAGLRGRKRWIFLGLFVIIYLWALTHLALTCVILGVLRFNFEGSPYLDFQQDGSLTFPRGANLSSVRLASTPSSVHSHTNNSLTVTGTVKDKVAFHTSSMERLSLDSSSIDFSSQSMNVYSVSNSGVREQVQISVTDSSVEMTNLFRANNLTTSRLSANTVTNVSVVRTNRQLSLTGAVGVALQGSQVDLAGQMGVSITSQEGQVSIQSEQVFLSSLSSSIPVGNVQYHLCSCDNGRLFLVESNPQRCNESIDISLCT